MELTPRGTYGFSFPKLPGFVLAAMLGVSVLAYRLLGDRMKVQGQPLVLVTTVGARTGKTRKTLLCRFPEGESYLVVASAAGAANHPAWYFNMARNPDQISIEIRGKVQRVRPVSLQADERAAAFERICALAPVYAGYTVKTDREIPVVRLTPIPL